jgi:hypothetical protein
MMRDQLSRLFKAHVYDTYGAQEFSRIATQCVVTGEYPRLRRQCSSRAFSPTLARSRGRGRNPSLPRVCIHTQCRLSGSSLVISRCVERINAAAVHRFRHCWASRGDR